MVQLVGILNLTPDSFQKVGRYVDVEKALTHASQLFTAGAAFIDVGAEATNPYVEPIDFEEEWRRLEPVLLPLLKRYPGRVSVDTYHPETAKRAIKIGPVIINDVTNFHDPEMIEVVAKAGVTCIASHLPDWVDGDIQLAHKSIDKLIDDEEIVKNELLARRQQMINVGVKPDKIILDPGIGFGKTPELNRRLLRFAEFVPGIEVMIGFSHKRFLGEDKRHLPGPNQEAAKIATESGARYLRVHEIDIYR